jgi:EmrB/QacA subfamily drug resistance transporter
MISSSPVSFFVKRPYYPWLVVATVCVGAFMAALDASIVNVALPTMLTHFRGGIHRIEWISVAYLLTLTALLPILGKASDMLGRRFMYSLGFLVFIIGSLLCGLALHLPFLIFARVIQAMGASMLQSNSVAIVTAAVPTTKRGKAIGIQGSAQAVGLAAGPVIGGILVTHWGWPAIFYVNVPIGIIGMLLGFFILPQDEKHNIERFDFVGALFLTPALVFGLLALTDGNDYGWLSNTIFTWAALSLILLVIFYLWERKTPNPMLDLSLFRLSVFSFGNIAGLLSFSTVYGVLFLVPFYLEHIHHLQPSQSGFLLTPVPIAMALFTPLAGSLADRFGSRKLTTSGMGITTVGTIMLVCITAHTTSIYIIAALILVGMGQGIFTPSNNSSVMGSVSKDQFGMAGGILNMSRSLGMSLGIAFSGAIYQFTLANPNGLFNSGIKNQELHAFQFGFSATVILGILAIISAWAIKTRPPSDSN